MPSECSAMELIWDPEDVSPNYVWSYSEFLDQYNELYEWLVQIQLKLYSHSDPQDISDQQEKLQQHQYRLNLFICQGEKVAEKFSMSKDEITWRVSYLTDKWNQLQSILTPCKGYVQGIVMEVDLVQEETFLRNWLDVMEDQIQPITCILPKGCSLSALQERYKNNQILLKDVKAHGPIIKNVIRQYERQVKNGKFIKEPAIGEPTNQKLLLTEDQINCCQVASPAIPRRVKGLEKRWHRIYLRALEWHYYLEGVIRDFKIHGFENKVSDSEDEPASKCRRISAFTNSEVDGNKLCTFGWSDFEYSSSENGSYIEDDYVMTNSVVDEKKANVFDEPPLSSKNNIKFTSFFNEKIIEPSKATIEMNSYVINSTSNFSYRENNYNDGTNNNDDNGNYNSNVNVKDSSNNSKETSKLTDISRGSPNCGVFDYKYIDSDSENYRNDKLSLGLKRYNQAGYPFDKTKNRTVNSSKKLKSAEIFVDEDQEQQELQEIIDSAVLDPDWLDGNITVTESDHSDESVECAPHHVSKEMAFEDVTSDENTKMTNTDDVPCDKKFIHQLVKDVENLVKEPIKFQGIVSERYEGKPLEKLTESKQCQIKRWLNNNQCSNARSVIQMNDQYNNNTNNNNNNNNNINTTTNNNNMQDSCDASGELTTGESDFESKESDFEGFNTSVGTEKGNNETLQHPSNISSVTESHFNGYETKVIKGKKRLAQRPHSANIVCGNDGTFCLMSSKCVFSSSETALDHMEKIDRKGSIPFGRLSNNRTERNGGSFDSLNENALQFSPSSLPSSNNYRRRRLKLRRRFSQSLNAKDGSGIEVTFCSSGGKRDVVAKCSSNQSPFHTPTKGVSSESDNVSSSSKFSRILSPTGKYLSRTIMTSSTEKCLSDSSYASGQPFPKCNESNKVKVDSPIESTNAKLSIQNHRVNLSDHETATHPEDASSLSEQAWDSYQEYKYLSEPYSEDVDVDAERKLIEFGDDYSKYIDSDESSFYNIPSRRRRSFQRRLVRNIQRFSDSDSDLEDMQRIVEESKYKLISLEKSLLDQLKRPSVTFNWEELIITARSNIRCLENIVQLKSEDPKTKSEMCNIRSIIDKWKLLEVNVRKNQSHSAQFHQLHQQLKLLKTTLENILNHSVFSVDNVFENFSQISTSLEKIKSLTSECENLKTEISGLNTKVHLFSSEIGSSFAPLKDEMTELYRIWDETYQRVTSKLTHIEQIEAVYSAWEKQKMELNNVLNQDSDALKVVDTAVDNGKLTESVTASVRDIANLLNEGKKFPCAIQPRNQYSSKEASENLHDIKKKSHLSDSGTSGYESCSSDDLSERERRLAYLKRLAKELEVSLLPECHAWKEINATLHQAEKKLKELQDHCRYLIRKTAETFEPSTKNLHVSSNSKRRILAREGKCSRNSRREKRTKIVANRPDWMWRVARAAVPFQITLMLLVCVACLLEPNCCDSVNTFNLSFTPQLRYVHGSPPV